MIDEELAAFFEGPVMMVFAARSATGWPALGRALGARVAEDRASIDIFVPSGQWPEALSGLAAGSQLAFTFTQPADYRTYQLKGELTGMGPSNAEDLAVVDRYVTGVTRALMALGVRPRQIEHWLTRAEMVTLRFRPAAAYTQTPGPNAGARLKGLQA